MHRQQIRTSMSLTADQVQQGQFLPWFALSRHKTEINFKASFFQQIASSQQHLLGSRLPCDQTENSAHFGCLLGNGLTISPQKSKWGLEFCLSLPISKMWRLTGPLVCMIFAGLLLRRRQKTRLTKRRLL